MLYIYKLRIKETKEQKHLLNWNKKYLKIDLTNQKTYIHWNYFTLKINGTPEEVKSFHVNILEN